MGTDLEKFKKVNISETIDELKEAIIFCGDFEVYDLHGRKGFRLAKDVSDYVDKIVDGDLKPHFLPKTFGIRQQALYLRYKFKRKTMS